MENRTNAKLVIARGLQAFIASIQSKSATDTGLGSLFLSLRQKKNVHCAPILLPIQIKMSTKTTGTVKFFNADKGFGFIKHDDSSKETFVHASGLIDQIKENDHVEFDLQNGKKGLNAVNVKLI